jgi:hypothetical protein
LPESTKANQDPAAFPATFSALSSETRVVPETQVIAATAKSKAKDKFFTNPPLRRL